MSKNKQIYARQEKKAVERLSLAPLNFETAIRATLATGKMPPQGKGRPKKQLPKSKTKPR